MRPLLRNSAALAIVFVYVVLGGALTVSAQQDTPILKGIVRGVDSAGQSVTVVLHHRRLGGPGEVDSVEVGPGDEFQFLLPTLRDDDVTDDVYFASVEYDAVVYFGPGITALEQLDSLYVVQVFPSEEVSPGGSPLLVERIVAIQFAGDGWIATDIFFIHNEGTRTLVAQGGGVVWSYPLPPGATEPVLADGGDLLPDAVTFAGGRVRVSGPLPPGGSGFMIRYRLEKLGSTFPAPGRTAWFEIRIEEPSPPLRVDGLEALDVVAIAGSTFRLYGGSELLDVNLTLIETEDRSPPPFGWAALLTAAMLAVGGFFGYAHPRGGTAAFSP